MAKRSTTGDDGRPDRGAPVIRPRRGSFDWREYLLALKQRLWLIILCAMAGVGDGRLSGQQGRAYLRIEIGSDARAAGGSHPEHPVREKSDTVTDGASFTTMLETLTSRTMMERVAERLKLDRDFVFMPKPKGREANDMGAVTGALRGCIRAARRGDTRLIDIVAEHTDPETAKRIADELATDFIRFRFEMKSAVQPAGQPIPPGGSQPAEGQDQSRGGGAA